MGFIELTHKCLGNGGSAVYLLISGAVKSSYQVPYITIYLVFFAIIAMQNAK